MSTIAEYDCIIEIAQNSDPVKYEIDKSSNRIRVDRFLNVSMHYPCNYGFFPNTLGKDGDPVDVLVMSRFPVLSGSIMQIRPIAVLNMEDESGVDEKIIAVPGIKIDPYYSHITDLDCLQELELYKIKHFFERYKDLEKDKWVKVGEFGNRQNAIDIIKEGIALFNKQDLNR